MRTLRLVLALSALAWLPGRAVADPPDPASVIGTFHDTLIAVMKDAKQLGFEGRYKVLEPAVDHTFNIPLMTQIVTGTRWKTWTDAQKAEITDAFRRFVIATYARRFDGYGGERFETEDAKPFNDGTLVKTELLHPPDAPVTLTYLMKENGAQPQAVDVFMTGTISELATRRSEFAAILERSGYQGLLKALDDKAQEGK